MPLHKNKLSNVCKFSLIYTSIYSIVDRSRHDIHLIELMLTEQAFNAIEARLFYNE